MAAGTVVNVWQDAQYAYLAVMVAEGGAQGNVEYIGKVALADLNALPTLAHKKAALVAATKAVRDAQQAGQQAIGGITGSVTL